MTLNGQEQSVPARGKGRETRERILSIAESAVLAKGFAATSIEEIIAEAQLTKSGFFYHFRDKNELAREMLRRYVATDEEVFDDCFGRAAALSNDPLEIYLRGLDHLAEVMRDLPTGHPGCLIAAICYQERLFDREVCDINRAAVESWNARFLAHLSAIEAAHQPRLAIPPEHLASMLTCILEGGIVLAKVLRDPRELDCQIRTYRTLIQSLFSPVVTGRG